MNFRKRCSFIHGQKMFKSHLRYKTNNAILETVLTLKIPSKSEHRDEKNSLKRMYALYTKMEKCQNYGKLILAKNVFE